MDTGQNRLTLEFTCGWCGWSRVPGPASCAKVEAYGCLREELGRAVRLWRMKPCCGVGACRKGSLILCQRQAVAAASFSPYLRDRAQEADTGRQKSL